MPKGKAPFPKKSAVDAGLADKSRPTMGGYKRAESTDDAVSRTIARQLPSKGGKAGFSSKSPGPGPDRGADLNILNERTKYAKGGKVK